MIVRIEEWKVKRRDTEQGMRHRQLLEILQERVRRFVQYKWLATRGVDEESILQSLPLDLQREIQRHLCISLVRRVCLSSYLVLLKGLNSMLRLILVCLGSLPCLKILLSSSLCLAFFGFSPRITSFF